MHVVRIIIEVLFWLIAAIVALLALNLAIGWALTPMMGYLCTIGLLFLLPLVTRAIRMVRRRGAAVAIAYLEQAVRLNLPLSRMLAAARQSERGLLAYRL